jgi:phosphatidylglycerophosphate synthase
MNVDDAQKSDSRTRLDRAAALQFCVTDRSATAPFLRTGVSAKVINILPAGYSPNALTLTGGAFALCSAAMLWLFADEMRAGSLAGNVMLILSGVFLVVYATFDQLDGMQARKQNRSSTYGDFLDHWVDTLLANSLTVPFMVLVRSDITMIWAMSLLTALAFFCPQLGNTQYQAPNFAGCWWA